MLMKFKNYVSDESGAISVDWVVITAAVVLLAGVVAANVRDSTIDAAVTIGEHVASRPTQ